MTQIDLSAEMRRAYAQSDAEIIISTVELAHPLITSPDGVAGVVRAAQSFATRAELAAEPVFTAKLETGAMATFASIGFAVTLPELHPERPGALQLEIANVSPEISRALRVAAYSDDFVSVTFREYLLDDAATHGPHFVLAGLSLLSAEITRDRVTATAEFKDLSATPFSRWFYDADAYPGLVR